MPPVLLFYHPSTLVAGHRLIQLNNFMRIYSSRFRLSASHLTGDHTFSWGVFHMGMRAASGSVVLSIFILSVCVSGRAGCFCCLLSGRVLTAYGRPQPKMKKRKSVTKLDAKDVINEKTSKYVLTHQDQDSQGEVETHMVKVSWLLLFRFCPTTADVTSGLSVRVRGAWEQQSILC